MKVIFLIFFNGYCSQYFVIFPWLGPSFGTHLRLLPLNVLLVMVWLTYYLSVTMDPGRVPLWYEPTETSAGKAGLRWCKICKVFKPFSHIVDKSKGRPRTHHCSICGRCVLKMDHHCPWTLNCIGAHNHAHFLRFLFYTILADFTVFAFLVRRIYAIYLISHLSSLHGPTTEELVFLILTTFSSFISLILISILLGYQVYSIIENTTTIEALEKQRVQAWVEKNRKQEIEFPYNTTLSENLFVVFGSDSFIFWLWPWNATTHDGLDYLVLEPADLPWPPPQTLPTNELPPPTAELPWSSARTYKDPAVSRLRRPYTLDEESGESEYESESEEEEGDDGEMFDGWFGMEDLEDYGVDVDSEIRGLRKEEEGVVWEEVLRRRREED